MQQKSMTALVSAFSRAYHSKNKVEMVFDDYLAEKIITKEEYNSITDNMSKGINYFNPNYKGSKEDGLKWIVDNQLSPSPLGRAAFCENSLKNAVKLGVKQYLIFGAGYDSFAYRKPDYAKNLKIFEIDKEFMINDKINRMEKIDKKPDNLFYISADFTDIEQIQIIAKNENFDKTKICFCSLLGLTYYLTKDSFKTLLKEITKLVPEYSTIIFDYPDEFTYTDFAGERTKKQTGLAMASGEKMLASYSYIEIEKLLSKNNFLIYEHLTPDEITKQYFNIYNHFNKKNKMTAFDNVNYCLAVKR
jgi:methyltransferase (TIGR00027 family)